MPANKPTNTNGGQLIQAQSTAGNNGDFHLVVLEPAPPDSFYESRLSHWWRNNSGDQTWARKAIISNAATDWGSIIQSTYGSGNLEVLVLEGQIVRHYSYDGSSWSPQSAGAIVSSNATGSPSFIQGSYGGGGGNQTNFEAVILEGQNLVHYWRNNSVPGYPWSGGTVITSDARSPGTIIECPVLGIRIEGPLNVIVQLSGGIARYWRDDSTGQWHLGEIFQNLPYIPVQPEGTWFHPGWIVQSTYVSSSPSIPNSPGNFEAIIYDVNNNFGIFHYWLDTSAVGPVCVQTSLVDGPAFMAGTIIQSDYGNDGNPGNFEAVILDPASGNTAPLVHYWRDNSDSSNPWNRQDTITEVYLGN